MSVLDPKKWEVQKSDPPSEAGGLFTVRRLGTLGRFGNALHLYIVAKWWAEKCNARLETPHWWGTEIFELDDPPITNPELHQCPFEVLPNKGEKRDIVGYFQHEKYWQGMTRKWLKSKLKVKQKWLKRFPRHPFYYYVAAHLRRGDYNGLGSIFCQVSQDSYYRALDEYGLDREMLVWVKEETQEEDAELQGLGIPFLKDFLKLVNANVILRANSTFSWWAATLSEAKVYSPLVEDLRGPNDVKFVEGNWPRLHTVKKYQPQAPGDQGDLHMEEG